MCKLDDRRKKMVEIATIEVHERRMEIDEEKGRSIHQVRGPTEKNHNGGAKNLSSDAFR